MSTHVTSASPCCPASRPETSTRFPYSLTGSRFLSGAAVMGASSSFLSKVPTAYSARKHSLSVACRRSYCGKPARTVQHFINHIAPLRIPHRLEYPLGSQIYLTILHQWLEARGRPFQLFLGGATCIEAIDPGTTGSTLSPAGTSRSSRIRGYFPEIPWPGSLLLAHGSPLHGKWFRSPTGLLLAAFCRVCLFSVALHLRHGVSLLTFAYHRETTSRWPVPRSCSVSGV